MTNTNPGIIEKECNQIDKPDSPTTSEAAVPILQGYLQKWTNYIHGWQNRWIVLTNNTLSYYKSDSEAAHGCRGAINLSRATIKPHPVDLCRFDISVNDCIWCLRAESEEDKQNWVDVLEGFKLESGYGSDSNSKLDEAETVSYEKQRNKELISLGKELKTKISELESYKNILDYQVDKIQTYLDTSVTNKATTSDVDTIDFRSETITLKDTTKEVLNTLNQCLDLLTEEGDMWGKRLEKETEKRKSHYAVKKQQAHQLGKEEESNGTNYTSNTEDEFYDAVETGSQMSEDFNQERRGSNLPLVLTPESATASHRLWPEIQKIVADQIHYARMGLGKGQWQLFADEGEMKMYRREEEIKGMVMDPLKACHVVKGVTGREMCHYFFRPEYRYEWETTLEKMSVAETISDDTIIFWQIHKSIWPVTQRDALFWSHLTQIPDPNDSEAHNIWVVVNNSTDLPQYPPNTGKYLRLFLTVCMLCQTIVTPPKQDSSITRQDISCKITYCSVVNPGGWAPTSLLRAVYKKEYPKFLKRFTAYVIEQCKNKPILY